MKIRMVFFAVAMSLFLAGCASRVTSSQGEALMDQVSQSSDVYLGYQPVDPVPVSIVTRYDKEKKQEIKCHWESLLPADKLALLPNQSAQVSVSKTDVNGELKYMAAAVSGAAGGYSVTMDYMKYRIDDVFDDSGRQLGSGKIGVGLRIKAEVVTSSASLNLGSLFALGVAAEANNLNGSISVEVIGIDSQDVTDLLPLSANIDQTSIQNSLQALASIKAKMWDKTTVTPQVIAFRQAVPGSIMAMKSRIEEQGLAK
jgi:hypothetical protein